MHSYPHVPEEILAAWPNCATPDCAFKSCTWAPDPSRCFPCNERRFGKPAMIDAYNETHDITWDEAERLDAEEDASK